MLNKDPPAALAEPLNWELVTQDGAQAEPYRQLGGGLGQLGFPLSYALVPGVNLLGDILGLPVGRQPRLVPGQPHGLTLGRLALERLTCSDIFRIGIRYPLDQRLILDLQLLPLLPFLLVSPDICSMHTYAAPN